jgi:hypothetical protein
MLAIVRELQPYIILATDSIINNPLKTYLSLCPAQTAYERNDLVPLR